MPGSHSTRASHYSALSKSERVEAFMACGRHCDVNGTVDALRPSRPLCEGFGDRRGAESHALSVGSQAMTGGTPVRRGAVDAGTADTGAAAVVAQAYPLLVRRLISAFQIFSFSAFGPRGRGQPGRLRSSKAVRPTRT